MRSGIHEDALQAMLEGGAVREVLVSRHEDKWALAIRLGGAGSRWLPAFDATPLLVFSFLAMGALHPGSRRQWRCLLEAIAHDSTARRPF